MPTLVERVSEDLKTAMKARDADRTRALRGIRAAFIEAEKEGKGAVTDERAVESLRKMRKQRVESADVYKAAGRPELAVGEEQEIAVIDGYLPRLADEATTKAWVIEAIATTQAKNAKESGKVVGAVMKAHKGEVDAGLAKKIAETLLPQA
jgi:uncharacterized protein